MAAELLFPTDFLTEDGFVDRDRQVDVAASERATEVATQAANVSSGWDYRDTLAVQQTKLFDVLPLSTSSGIQFRVGLIGRDVARPRKAVRDEVSAHYPEEKLPQATEYSAARLSELGEMTSRTPAAGCRSLALSYGTSWRACRRLWRRPRPAGLSLCTLTHSMIGPGLLTCHPLVNR